MTDAALVYIARMPNLRDLRLGGTKVTDAAIADLKRMRSLRLLQFYGDEVTPKGIEAVRTSLPSCKVFGSGREAIDWYAGN